MSILCKFAHFYMNWRHLVNLLPLDNAVLSLKQFTYFNADSPVVILFEFTTLDYS